jgi:hypothetical protein
LLDLLKKGLITAAIATASEKFIDRFPAVAEDRFAAAALEFDPFAIAPNKSDFAITSADGPVTVGESDQQSRQFLPVQMA